LKQRQVTERGSIGNSSCSTLIEEVRDEHRQRLLDPIHVPRELRGFKRRAPPNTALLTRIAFEAFKARMWADGANLTDQEAERLFRGECERISGSDG
jgi:hypothetical protein